MKIIFCLILFLIIGCSNLKAFKPYEFGISVETNPHAVGDGNNIKEVDYSLKWRL